MNARPGSALPGGSYRYRTPSNPVPLPAFRRLTGFSFDPSMATRLETALVAKVIFKIPWEPLQAGPVGRYLEVIDFDPASDCFYEPVDLDNPRVLAQDGLAPSEGNPQFHQQMVYAVAMTTIKNFERALGRGVFWAKRKFEGNELAGLTEEQKYGKEYVERLRIYPHALRQANAYYSPARKALLFGYFPAQQEVGGMVFSCLSHDIIAHETTHALLDGMYDRYMDAGHPDTRAFHEAFADIVALFQRFSLREVLHHQITRTRGDIAGTANMLGALAQQLGLATGKYGALRDAIGAYNEKTQQWEPLVPDPTQYDKQMEEHRRGAILVAAIFDAFLSIYRARVADLQRIATGGTGILPKGDIHPDLVNRFASEAAKVAHQILSMSIRALDYCPPVDITFGDYLRALITADYDLVPDDEWGYRVALIEAFRRRGILPEDIRTISEESLLWDRGETIFQMNERPSTRDQGPRLPLRQAFNFMAKHLNEEIQRIEAQEQREDKIEEPESGGDQKQLADQERFQSFRQSQMLCRYLEDFLRHKVQSIDVDALEELTGLKVGPGAPFFRVYNVRRARRVGQDGDVRSQMVISVLQEMEEKLDGEVPFTFRGGCTLILDMDQNKLLYAVKKPIADERRKERHRQLLRGEFGLPERGVYFGADGSNLEPFALLHGAGETLTHKPTKTVGSHRAEFIPDV